MVLRIWYHKASSDINDCSLILGNAWISQGTSFTEQTIKDLI